MAATTSASRVAEILNTQLHDLICHFRGPPNAARSDRSRTAWGNKGSLVLHLTGRRAGRWDDYQARRGGDALDLIRHELGATTASAMAWAAQDWLGGELAPALVRPRLALTAVDDRVKVERARSIWNESIPARGTIAEEHLRYRGLTVPGGDAIRFHPQLPWWDMETKRLEFVPCMVAPMRHIHTDELRAIHRTALHPDGSKRDRRMLGQAGGAVVKLAPDDAVITGLGLAEGIETALSVMQGIGWHPVWAATSAGAISAFPVLSGIDAITIFADHDKSGAGTGAAKECADRWRAAGREAYIATPQREGDDWNDVVRRAI